MRTLSIGLLFMLAFSAPGESLKFQLLTVDLQHEDQTMLFSLGGVYFADLIGGPEPELVVSNGFDGFEIWALNQQGRKPIYQHLASIPLSADDEAPLPQLFTFAHLSKNGKLSLVLADNAGVWHYPVAAGRFATKREQLLALSLPGAQPLSVTYLDFALDIDGDGLDELLLPEIDKPMLWQKPAAQGALPGTDWTPIALPGLEEKIYSSFSTFDFEVLNDTETFPPGAVRFSNNSQTPTFYFHDYNGDGKLDLFRLLRKPLLAPDKLGPLGDQGRQASQQERVEIDIRLFDEGRFATTATARLEGLAPVDGNSFFTDLNGDGLLDRVEAWANFDPVGSKSITRFYLSQGAPTFKIAAKQDYRFNSKNPFGDNYFSDVNNDGLVDLFLLDVEYMVTDMNDIGDIIFGKKMRLTLQGYLSRNGSWPENPDVRKALELVDFRERGMSNIMTLEHDFTGDGLADLAFASRAGRLDFYAYEKETRRFSRRKTGSCKDLGSIWTCADLNADGLADVISFDPADQRLIIQLSRQ